MPITYSVVQDTETAELVRLTEQATAVYEPAPVVFFHFLEATKFFQHFIWNISLNRLVFNLFIQARRRIGDIYRYAQLQLKDVAAAPPPPHPKPAKQSDRIVILICINSKITEKVFP